MRLGTWSLLAVALMAAAGCHKKAEPAQSEDPQFSPTLASGSAGDTMQHLAQQYGIPIYPNSVPDTAHFNGAENTQTRLYLAYSTTDSVDKVVEFYKAGL